MSRSHVFRSTVAVVLTSLLSAGHPPRPQTTRSRDPRSALEKAVAAVQSAFPKAEFDEVAEPKGFGGSGGKGTPMF